MTEQELQELDDSELRMIARTSLGPIGALAGMILRKRREETERDTCGTSSS